jgi:tetratricopeptide (TPR) repeat protein
MSIKNTSLLLTLFVTSIFCGAFETPKDAIAAARKAMFAKKYSEAHQALNEGFKLSINYLERFLVLSLHADLYRVQRQYSKAEELIQKILDDKQITPNQKANSCLALGRIKEAQKKLPQAILAYQKTLQYEKDGLQAFEAINKIGLLKFRLKKYSEALTYYNQALKVEIKDKRRATALKSGVYGNISTLYTLTKQYDKAVKVLEDAAKLPEFSDKRIQRNFNSNIVKVYEFQLRELVALRKFDQADKILSNLKAKDNSSKVANLEVSFLMGKAALAKRTRKIGDAEKCLTTALAIKGASSGVMLNVYGDLLSLYRENKKTSQVAQTLKAIDDLKLTNPEDIFSRGNIKYRHFILAKQYPQAVKCMEETALIKVLRPARDARCYENLANFYLGQKDLAKAKEYYQKATNVTKGNFKSPYLKKKLGL